MDSARLDWHPRMSEAIARGKSEAVGGRNERALNSYNRAFNRRINDIYVDTAFIVGRLGPASTDGSRKRLAASKFLDVRVPAHNGFASIQRKPAQVEGMLEDARSFGQWEKSLIFVVSLTEDHISSFLRTVLRLRPILLLTSIGGNKGNVSISLADMIKVGPQALLEEQISSRISSAIYASPREYIGYLEKIIGANLDEDRTRAYVELKARRDIIIHANGFVNQIYLDKAGELAAGVRVGDRLRVDKVCFDGCVTTIKNLAQSIFELVLDQFAEDEGLAPALKLSIK